MRYMRTRMQRRRHCESFAAIFVLTLLPVISLPPTALAGDSSLIESNQSAFIGQDDSKTTADTAKSPAVKSAGASPGTKKAIRVISADGIVTFPDSALEAAVSKALGKSAGEITHGDLRSLTVLKAKRKGITDLTGLETASKLEEVDLRYNKIKTLTPLGVKKALKIVSLGGNQIEDLTPLARLTSLEVLDLRRNQITSLEPLSRLTNLKRLDISDNECSDLRPLVALTGLEALTANGCGIADVGHIADLTQLSTLYLMGNEIQDIDALASLSNVKRLILAENQIESLEGLAPLDSLDYLSLTQNRIEDISPLVENPGIEKGDQVLLRGNPLSFPSRSDHLRALKTRGVDIDMAVDDRPPKEVKAVVTEDSQEDADAEADDSSREAGDIAVGTEEYLPTPDEFVPVEELPVPLSLPEAELPDMAREEGIEGTVWVQVLVSKNGDVIDALIYKDSGTSAGLEEAALRAAKKGKWKPAIQNKQPVAVWTAYEIEFKLSN